MSLAPGAVAAASRRAAGGFLRGVGSGADRLLHPLRRRRALRALGRLPRSARLLFVCKGNICRSPYAEHRFRALVAGPSSAAPVAASAGLQGPGRPSPPEAVDAAAARGLDMAAHRSRVLDAGEAAGYDLVVAMEARQARAVRGIAGRRVPVLLLGDLDPSPVRSRGIVDPWGRPEPVARAVYDRLDRCLEVLAARWTGPVPSPSRVTPAARRA